MVKGTMVVTNGGLDLTMVVTNAGLDDDGCDKWWLKFDDGCDNGGLNLTMVVTIVA